ncbi:hypothetical protein Tco_0168676 [Tanacetum coccineum]
MAGSDDENPPPPPPPPPQNTGHNTPLTLLSYWEVIQRGRKWSYECSNDTNGVIKVLPLKTAEEKSPPEEGNIRSSLGLSLLPVLKISLIYENQAKMVDSSDTEVISCSTECKESYAKLKKLYDEQREQLGDASIEIQAYTQALKKDVPHKALENKGIVDSGCSRHMTGNKAYLAEYQDYNGGPVAFGGSKGFITVFCEQKNLDDGDVFHRVIWVPESNWKELSMNNQAIFDTIQLMGYRPSESQPIPSPSHPSEDQPESQPDPSPGHSPLSLYSLISNPEGSGGNQGGHNSSLKE